MKRPKVAVCMSGQARTWRTGVPSIQSFYNRDEWDVSFFGHTWNSNSWRDHGHDVESRIEKLDDAQLRTDLQREIGFSKLLIQDQVHPMSRKTRDGHSFYTTYEPQLKSAALAMHLKDQFEVNNKVKFDVVVHARFDLAYHPSDRLAHHVPKELIPDAVYCRTSNFSSEFRMPLIDDVIYLGSSRAMSILDSFYFYYTSGKFHEMMNYSYCNLAMDCVGPGVLLYKWITLKNLKIVDRDTIYPCIIRSSVADARWPDEHHRIEEAFLNYGVAKR